MTFSDYIVFADESGDHGLDGIDAEFPVFALVFCLIKKTDYVEKVVPEFQRLKFTTWGHDGVILHEHEIRKTKGDFGILRTNHDLRLRFFEQLNALIEDAPVTIFASVIDKNELKSRYETPWNPYEIALLFCMERLLLSLLKQGQEGTIAHVLFESRGKKEDAELELEFRRVCANKRDWGYKTPDFLKLRFEPVFVPKAANSVGLQLADLTARPIALNSLRPGQKNRAFEIIKPKLGGLKCFP
ncbi:MAG: DUF3800 domain-containing protein [Holophaga sp.]|nr:DUF3800 domain-containing protein [Holophaga sp.]